MPPPTLQEWLASVPEFAATVRAGRALADAEVADRLWRRAVGYSHAAVRILSHQGKALEVAYTEHYPPDIAREAARQVLALNPGFTVNGFATAHRPAPEVFARYAEAWREAGLPE